MSLKAVICHISCLLIAVALYGMSGVYSNFQMNLNVGPVILLAIGLIGISYCSYISQEKAVVTTIKLLALSIQWFLFMFGSVLAINALTNSPWFLYLGGALVCGCMFVVLFRVQSIGSEAKNA